MRFAVKSGDLPSDGGWVHITLVKDGSQTTLYVNGIKQQQTREEDN